MSAAPERLRRLLAPRTIAVVGGAAAAEAVRQCRAIGFSGEIWPVHPRHASVEGRSCYRDVDALPAAPDAAFVAVPDTATVDVVARLAARGTGGVVCHASGFAELGAEGARKQRELVAAAGETALIGPNCIGVLNCLDGAAMWPDQHGGQRVARGVGIITQSGNIAQNLSMQRRSLPLAQLITIGNAAGTGVAELVEAMLADERITAIGLHLEGIADAPGLAKAGIAALRKGVPIVVLKSGRSELGARVGRSHTSSLAGSDELCNALFDKAGMARSSDVPEFVETLKFLHVHGGLRGARIASASCSGGEAAMVADLATNTGVELPELPTPTAERLQALLGERVPVGNPLDYHTYIWGDREAQEGCFTELLGAGMDASLLLLDFPLAERCADEAWHTTVDAFIAAHRAQSGVACVVASLPENLPEPVRERLREAGIAPMQGLRECLAAVAAAARIGAAALGSAAVPAPLTPAPLAAPQEGPVIQLDEPAAKDELAAAGVAVPAGQVTAEPERAAAELGFPVVLKAASAAMAHKSEQGGVVVNLRSAAEVRTAAARMRALGERFLVERMVAGALAELLVGVRTDPQFGRALTVAAGGVHTELLRDAVTLLLPVTRTEIADALGRLRIWPLLSGFRGRAADVPAVCDAIEAIGRYACTHEDVSELEVNPLLALPDGAVAVDAVLHRRKDADD